eukprot:TRINITY_DN19126_c2_g1_i3.p1 TRINITY_DN19126_c2_g1~~TRINITY_DN19126_c2_g1_i3.p1  ORF type:complete len:128 (+),score=17.47 TRINITY_DN19126_c2_g1_i3:377-760(+)
MAGWCGYLAQSDSGACSGPLLLLNSGLQVWQHVPQLWPFFFLLFYFLFFRVKTQSPDQVSLPLLSSSPITANRTRFGSAVVFFKKQKNQDPLISFEIRPCSKPCRSPSPLSKLLTETDSLHQNKTVL